MYFSYRILVVLVQTDLLLLEVMLLSDLAEAFNLNMSERP